MKILNLGQKLKRNNMSQEGGNPSVRLDLSNVKHLREEAVLQKKKYVEDLNVRYRSGERLPIIVRREPNWEGQMIYTGSLKTNVDLCHCDF